jgi:hypothetical protein
VDVSGQFHAPTALSPERTLGTRWTVGELQSQLDAVEKRKRVLSPPGIELRFSGCPARSLVKLLGLSILILSVPAGDALRQEMRCYSETTRSGGCPGRFRLTRGTQELEKLRRLVGGTLIC